MFPELAFILSLCELYLRDSYSQYLSQLKEPSSIPERRFSFEHIPGGINLVMQSFIYMLKQHKQTSRLPRVAEISGVT